MRCITQGRRVIVTLRSLQCDTPAYGARQGRSLEVALYSFAIFLFQPPRPAGTPPIFLVGTPRNAAGHGKGRRLNTNDFLSLQKIVSVALDSLYLFILLSSEKNEPFGLLFLLTPPSLRTPPLYFAVQNTEEEIESNPPLIAVRYPRIRGTARGEG